MLTTQQEIQLGEFLIEDEELGKFINDDGVEFTPTDNGYIMTESGDVEDLDFLSMLNEGE